MRYGFFRFVCWRSLSDSAYLAWWWAGRFTVMIVVMLSASVPASGAFYSPPPPVCDGRHASLMPGVGLGPVRIGQNIKTVLDVLQAYIDAPGGPQDPNLVGWGYRDPNVVQPEPLVLIYHNRVMDVALRIAMHEAGKCFTPAGIRLGSPKDAIRAAYGDPPSTRTGAIEAWVYNVLGIAFEFDLAYSSAEHLPPSATTRIEVFAPGQFCDTLDLTRQVTIWGLHRDFSCSQFAPPP